MLKAAGVYFFNPLDLLFRPELVEIESLLEPQLGQDGTPYYAFARYFHQEGDDPGATGWLHGKHGATSQALGSVLQEILRRMYWRPAGAGGIVYTHLGDRVGNQLAPRLGWSEELHTAWETVAEYVCARDRIDRVPFRVWFASPSSVLAFAAVMRGLAQNLSVDGDEVRITSWHDENLSGEIPDAARFGSSWLHGVTVYVADPSRARVWVDGVELAHFTRNPGDATGRPSITLVDATGALALLPASPSERADAQGSREILLGDRGVRESELAVANVPLRHATHWTFRIRAEAGAAGWIDLVTDDGRVYRAATSGDAHWPLETSPDGEWRTHTLPLADGAGVDRPRGRVTALRFGRIGGGSVAFSGLSVLRPRPCQPLGLDRILAGRVTDLTSGRPRGGVRLRVHGRGRSLETRTNAEGFYLFRGLPADRVARVEVEGGGVTAHYLRGRDAYLACDQWDFDVEL